MDCTKKLDFNKYVVSLDTLDLALLSSCTSKVSNNCKQNVYNLNSNSNNYFEFEIANETNGAASNGKSLINIVSDASMYPQSLENHSKHPSPKSESSKEISLTICYICDLEVPTAYLTDHERSLKHKAYLKLAEVILERTRKHMLKKNTQIVKKNASKYFCGPCVLEVPIKDEHNHEKSKHHKQCTSYDKLLYELVTLFTDGHENAESGVIDADNLDSNTNGLKTEDDNKNEVGSNKNTVLISDIKSRLNELELKTVENYIKLIDECDVNKPYDLSSVGNDIKISMEDGSEVIVPEDNFNGFLRMDNNFIMCIVCKMVVGNENTHKTSETHIKNIIIPFNDWHCLRNVDNSCIHCVICNKIVDNAELHVLCDKTHTELQQKATVSKNKPRELLKTCAGNENLANEECQKAYVVNEKKTDGNCKVNKNTGNENDSNTNDGNLKKDTNVDQLQKSNTLKENMLTANKTKPKIEITNSVDHTMTNDIYHCFPCNLKMHVNNINSHVIGKKHKINSISNIHYFMTQDVGASDFCCRVCKIYITDDVVEVTAHVATSDHVEKYTKLLSENSVIPEKGNFYCEHCQEIVLKRTELDHIEKLNHESNLITRQTTPDINTFNKDATVNNPTNAPTKVAYYCGVCDVSVPNNPYNINTHNDGARHKKNDLNTKLKEVDSIENITGTSNTETEDINYELEATDNKKSLMCKVCKNEVANREDCITEHVVGKKHQSNLKTILDGNKIECKDEKYHCINCKCDFKNQYLFTHINQAQHKLLLDISDKEKTVLTKTANEKVDINESDTESIDNLSCKYRQLFIESKDKKTLQCKVCYDKDIPQTAKDVSDHTAKPTHSDKFYNLLADKFILKMEQTKKLCVICLCLVPLTGEVQHARGGRHNENFFLAIGQDCKVCNVNKSDVCMYDHIISTNHVKRVLENYTFENLVKD